MFITETLHHENRLLNNHFSPAYTISKIVDLILNTLVNLEEIHSHRYEEITINNYKKIGQRPKVELELLDLHFDRVKLYFENRDKFEKKFLDYINRNARYYRLDTLENSLIVIKKKIEEWNITNWVKDINQVISNYIC